MKWPERDPHGKSAIDVTPSNFHYLLTHIPSLFLFIILLLRNIKFQNHNQNLLLIYQLCGSLVQNKVKPHPPLLKQKINHQLYLFIDSLGTIQIETGEVSKRPQIESGGTTKWAVVWLRQICILQKTQRNDISFMFWQFLVVWLENDSPYFHLFSKTTSIKVVIDLCHFHPKPWPKFTSWSIIVVLWIQNGISFNLYKPFWRLIS